MISSSDINCSLIVILSLNLIKCGDVYRPTLYPADLNMDASIDDVDPFPFVPAI
jgi:hypothetical protein